MLRMRDVHAGYGATPILFGVSLEVRAGEAVALLGKNGMGKTTLMKTVIGFLKPTRGSIAVRGHRATPPRRPPLRRAARAAPRGGLPALPATSRTAAPGRPHPLGRRAADARDRARDDGRGAG